MYVWQGWADTDTKYSILSIPAYVWRVSILTSGIGAFQYQHVPHVGCCAHVQVMPNVFRTPASCTAAACQQPPRLSVGLSVPAGRLFSEAGELISARRNRLKPKHVNMFLFLNQNLYKQLVSLPSIWLIRFLYVCLTENEYRYRKSIVSTVSKVKYLVSY